MIGRVDDPADNRACNGWAAQYLGSGQRRKKAWAARE
jgi:hypothetical protein